MTTVTDKKVALVAETKLPSVSFDKEKRWGPARDVCFVSGPVVLVRSGGRGEGGEGVMEEGGNAYVCPGDNDVDVCL